MKRRAFITLLGGAATKQIARGIRSDMGPACQHGRTSAISRKGRYGTSAGGRATLA